MSAFEDMTLMELAEIAYDILCDRVYLSQGEIIEFQQVFSDRIEQCERLELLKGKAGLTDIDDESSGGKRPWNEPPSQTA